MSDDIRITGPSGELWVPAELRPTEPSANERFLADLREALSRPIDEPGPREPGPREPLRGTDEPYPPVSERARPAVSPRRSTPRGAATGPASKEPGTHPCPGCTKPVLDHLLACRGCWAALPRTSREQVVRGWTRDPLVAANALVSAVTWWRAHPR